MKLAWVLFIIIFIFTALFCTFARRGTNAHLIYETNKFARISDSIIIHICSFLAV